MVLARVRPSWHLPPSAATPERVYRNRREFLAGLGAVAGAVLLGCEDPGARPDGPLRDARPYPRKAPRNARYKLDRPLTPEPLGAAYNNYYEFTTAKEKVWKLARRLTTRPWRIVIAGHCKRTGPVDLDELLKRLPQEERLYRHRCVETWAMAVPWIGIPMRVFLKWVEPTSKARYVRFVTVHRPKEMTYEGAGWARESFPYYEGLRLDEAACELTLLATGLYGRELPKQNGAPIRLVVPWKYGFKSIKSIARIEFTAQRPRTFWNDLQPREYGFFANVNPDVPHPRWSQKTERLLGEQERRPTLLFNGYADIAGDLYRGLDLKKNY